MLAAKQAGFAVIGIEGFRILDGGGIRPNLDEIADFSSVSTTTFDELVRQCFEAANFFLQKMNVEGKSDGYCFVMSNSVN